MALPQWKNNWRILISKVRLVQSNDELLQEINRLCCTKSPHVLAFVNAHAMNCVAESDIFYAALHNADTIFRDGSGMSVLLKLLGQSPGINLNGTDLIPQIIANFNGQTIALYGTEEPYLQQARDAVHKQLAPQSLIHTANGFLKSEQYVELAIAHKPQLIVLGMGMPKQEEIASQLRSQLSDKCLIVCGGAIIDFLGNKVTRAPLWLRRIGMEWIYRLLSEPRRLFKRYVIGNPKFLSRTLLLKCEYQN